MFDAALENSGRGWSVMPVSRASGKRPLEKWKQFQTVHPSRSMLHYWFTKHSGCNLGLITGAISDCFIVDTDTPEAARWFMGHDDLPGTPIVQGSADYKLHFYFKHPGFSVSNSVKKIHPGADVRGDGGYAVLPPSVHQNGTTYQWIVTPEEVPLPDAPQWLLDLVKKKEFVPRQVIVPVIGTASKRHQRYANRALEIELANVATAPDGKKHDQLFQSVAKVAEFVPHGLLSESEITGYFFGAVEGRAKNKRGALETIEKAIQRGKCQPRVLPR
jgi:hypothetical protein